MLPLDGLVYLARDYTYADLAITWNRHHAAADPVSWFLQRGDDVLLFHLFEFQYDHLLESRWLLP